MLSPDLITEIISFVKEEPRNIQEISLKINKSWVTTEKYVKFIERTSGQIRLKVFRQGTKSSLKIVYFVSDTHFSDRVKQRLFQQIISSTKKDDFDVLDIYQFIPKNKKTSSFSDGSFAKNPLSSYARFLRRAKTSVLIYSGNLSFVDDEKNGDAILETFEHLLNEGVSIKILSRIKFSTLKNLDRLKPLLTHKNFEIRHAYQPLRGCIIDGVFGRLYQAENVSDYREGELSSNIFIAYDFEDSNWVSWLESVFWSIWRDSLDYSRRLDELI